VRNLEPQARFQDAQALRDADLFIRIGNRDHAAPTLAQAARAARDKDQRQSGGIADRKVKQRDLVKSGALRWRQRFDMLSTPLRILAQRTHFLGAVMRTDHRQWRQQNRNGEEDRRRPFEKLFQPQPEIEPNAGVRPRDRQKRKLHRDHVRP
jgi:hypothetical protein